MILWLFWLPYRVTAIVYVAVSPMWVLLGEHLAVVRYVCTYIVYLAKGPYYANVIAYKSRVMDNTVLLYNDVFRRTSVF